MIICPICRSIEFKKQKSEFHYSYFCSCRSLVYLDHINWCYWEFRLRINESPHIRIILNGSHFKYVDINGNSESYLVPNPKVNKILDEILELAHIQSIMNQ